MWVTSIRSSVVTLTPCSFLGVCHENVHSLVRIAFHDAIGFSANGKLAGTGADGSIVLFEDQELKDSKLFQLFLEDNYLITGCSC